MGRRSARDAGLPGPTDPSRGSGLPWDDPVTAAGSPPPPPRRRPVSTTSRPQAAGGQPPRPARSAQPPRRPPTRATGRASSGVASSGQKSRFLDYPRHGRRGVRRWIPSWKLVGGLFLTGLLFAVGLFLVVLARTEVPDPNELVGAQTTTVYFADGTTPMGEFAAQNRTIVTDAEIPEHVKQAMVAAEDRGFYENNGVSPTGIVRAFWNNLRGNDTQGGSTITQQYVKNYFLEPEQSYQRKIEEAFIAIKSDQQLSKDEILTRYLNTIYFGRGAYGIQAASEAYFGKNVGDLTPQDAALLSGIIPAPSTWDPAVDPAQAQERYAYVMDGMVELGYLDEATRAASPDMPPTIEYVRQDTFAGTNGYLLATAREELLANSPITENELDRGGLRIVTTIDPAAQAAAVAAVQDPEILPPEERPETLRVALAAIDPATGAVRAMYGGPDYITSPRNAVTQDIAQAGSTFKPFTLIAALEQDISLDTTFDGSSPQEFPGFYTNADGDAEEVENFGDSSYGSIDLVRATRSSVNTVYVGLNEEVGAEASADVAVRAGIDPGVADLAVPSNVLGSPSVNPLDMAQAYATFAAQGVRHTPHIVATVEDETGLVYEGSAEGEQVIRGDVMADATYAMTQVVENGSGEYASRLDRPVAGKTGTSTSNRSAWFTGYVPQMAAAVALYNVGPNGEQLEIPEIDGREVTGGSYPVEIWTAFMEAALENVDEADFPDRANVGEVPEDRRPPPPPEPEPTQEPAPPPETSAPPPPPSPEPSPPPSSSAPPTSEPPPTDPDLVFCRPPNFDRPPGCVLPPGVPPPDDNP